MAKSRLPCAVEDHGGHLDHTACKRDGPVRGEDADQQPGGEHGGIAGVQEGDHAQKKVHGGVEGGAGTDQVYHARLPTSVTVQIIRKMAKRSCFWSAWSVRPSRMTLVTAV